jgi:ABC-type transport system substrate-binding protein
MRTRTPFRVAAAAATLALLVTACGGGGEEPAPGAGGTPDETPTESEEPGDGGSEEPAAPTGGTYAAELTEPSFLAPASNCYESECSAVLSMINDPLVNTTFPEGELEFTGLAESIESDEAQTVWTVTLKPDRKFHNGEPVNADAFLRGWNYSQNPDNAQATAGFMARILGAGEGKSMKGLKKIDDLTFEVTLDGAFSQFGQQMSYGPAFAPLPQECLDDLKACNEKPIGTGPYMMDGKWQHDQAINVTKWADYQGEAPANADTIEFTMFTNPTAAFRDYQNGGVDVLTIAPEVYLDAKQALGDEIIEEPTATLTYLGFPTKEAPYDNVKLRQAMSLAIDREAITEAILNGLAIPSTDIVTPPIPGSRDNACEFCEYDPERAKQLLEESGVDTEGLTAQYYFNADAGHDLWVEAAARQIQETLGIDYELQSTEWAQYLELLDKQEFTGPFRLGWALDYPSPENYIRPIVGTGGDSNYTGYSNARLDDLLIEGDRAETLDEGIGFYQQAGDVALEDMPIIPMWSGVTAIAASDEIAEVRYDVGEGEIQFGEITVVQ